MTDKNTKIADRKKDHLAYFEDQSCTKDSGTWFDCIRLVHNALPELDLADIDLETEFAGHKFAAPIFVTAMTGGVQTAKDLNRSIAKAAQKLGIGFGLGSQRVMLENPDLVDSFFVEDVANNFVAGNIGAVQLGEYSIRQIENMLSAVGANALCVHLNPAQEIVQAGGTCNFKGIETNIEQLVNALDLPVIVKEVGTGISRDVALRLKGIGVKYIDLAGFGGTSFVDVELSGQDEATKAKFEELKNWGIPSAACVFETRNLGLQIMASGGVRSGYDAACAIAFGADIVGVAASVLISHQNNSESGCLEYLKNMIDQLKVAMLLTGSSNIRELKTAKHVVVGELLEWIKQRKNI